MSQNGDMDHAISLLALLEVSVSMHYSTCHFSDSASSHCFSDSGSDGNCNVVTVRWSDL